MRHTIARYTVKLVRESNSLYSTPKQCQSASDIADLCRVVLGMGDEPVEVLAVVFMDVKNKVIGVQEISRGTVSSSLVHPREVLKGAILANASSIILVHNHPSGDVNPSHADKQVTATIKQASTLMQIELLDHVIIASDSHYSFRDNGML